MLDWLLPDGSIFSHVRWHGNTKWLPKSLVWLALTWAWSESRNVTDAFAEALEGCDKAAHSQVPRTYQGFMGALAKWTSTLVALLCVLLQERMAEIGGKFWRIDGWLPIAFDGSRNTAPRTESNEGTLCARNYGHGMTAKYRKKKSKGMRRRKNERNKAHPPRPQVWITLMWHMGLRLPWAWRLGPSNASERAHVSDMVASGEFPENTLFCGDAGFVGYDFWKQMRDRGCHFLVRVGANVSLLAETTKYERLNDSCVLCWPQTMIKAQQAPLRLRLVKVRIGKTKVFMLTSVLDAAHLTPQQIVKLYKLRWGVEVEFRGLKQTLDRSKLRCRNDRRVLAELDWSIMAMAVAELFALKVQLSKRRNGPRKEKGGDPARRSLANTMRAIRYCLRALNDVTPTGKDLDTLLGEAITDGYQRKSSKKARYRPPNPDKKPLGEPSIRKLTNEERHKLRHTEKPLAA